MAPITRSSMPMPAMLSHPHAVPKSFRDPSFQYASQDSGLSERQASEDPSSFDGSEMNSALEEDIHANERQSLQITSAEDHEDILYPLREAANRVGREVEKFAEVLDGYNPLRATDDDEKREMTSDLIDIYHDIAVDTLDRLRDQHAGDRVRKNGRHWSKKVRGFKYPEDEEVTDVEDPDEQRERYPLTRTTLEDVHHWEQEAQTWDLLKRLVKLRFAQPEAGEPKPLQPVHQYSTEQDVWEHFLESDKSALERKTVLRWLKDTAEDSGENIDDLVEELQQNAERGDIIAHGWIHTKEKIKFEKRKNTWSGALDPSLPQVQRTLVQTSTNELLVTQLDPDSTTRQHRKLVAADEYFERAIWMGCYEMLRRGRSAEDVRDWCLDRTEVWRAVSMSGLPDEKTTDDEEIPTNTALWRRMCYALAQKGGGDKYEKAVYGILSGDIQSVEPVCHTWDDFVFVHYNALLRSQFEQFQQQLPGRAMTPKVASLAIFDAVQFHGHPIDAGDRLVETLKTDSRTSAETQKPMKMIQGVLIADRFSNFIYQQGLALSKYANQNHPSILIPPSKEEPENQEITKYIGLNEDHDSLRVLTHMLLIFKGLGLNLGGIERLSVMENVIVAYISFLKLSGKEELIPLYCSQLSGNRRYATLCRNLIDVTDEAQRVTQIKLMRELGLDVQQFVKFQSRYLLTDYSASDDGYPAMGNFRIVEPSTASLQHGRPVMVDFGQIDKVDELLVRSLEWYLLIDGLWSETFHFGTLLYLRFFKNMRLKAAERLAIAVSSASVALRKTPALLGESLDIAGLEDYSDATGVLDGLADQNRYLKNHMLSEAKSFRELEAMMEFLSKIQKITELIARCMRTETEPTERRIHRNEIAEGLQRLKDDTVSLLKGWLTTSQRPEHEREFKLLREAYLPETTMAYISVMHLGGGILSRDFILHVMDVSAIIAEEDSDLLEVFTETGRLPELMDALAVASKALLLLTAEKKGTSSSKKLRMRGWTHELWSIKQ